MREQFEKLPEIEQGLRFCRYNGKTKYYCPDVPYEETHEWHTQFVNGAWYAFQEQQKIINNVYSIIHDVYTDCPEDSVKDIYDKIKDLLK